MFRGVFWIFVIIFNFVTAMEKEPAEKEQPNLLSDLPIELQIIVASFLVGNSNIKEDIISGLKDLESLSKVNKFFFNMIKSFSFWKKLMNSKSKNLTIKEIVDMVFTCPKSACLAWLRDKAETTDEIKKHLNSELLKIIENSSIIVNTVFIRKTFDYVQKIKFLTKAGADIDVKGKYDYTPLMTACKKKDLELVELLLKLGAGIDKVNERWKTALIIALDNDCREIALKLIKEGADFKIADIHDVTPIMLAHVKNYQDIVELLIKSGAKNEILDKTDFLSLQIRTRYP